MSAENRGPSLSLCMIVKNEERFLPHCLESVRSWVDEMIIVDTGSSDRSIAIARTFGAKVFEHPWENDFSKHRNQSIDYATGNWILILDGDEVLGPDSGEAIRKGIEQDGIDSLFVPVVCYFENRSRSSWNNSLRVFKKCSGIHFEGIVHNQLTGYTSPGFCDARIYNYGYDMDQLTVKRKFERTSTLLKRSIEKDPDNYRYHHDLAVSCSSVGLYLQAVDYGLKAIALHKCQRGSDPNILWTHFVVASSYFNLGETDKAEETARKALELNDEYMDAYFILATIFAARKDKVAFAGAYDTFVRLQQVYRESPALLAGLVVNKMDETWRLDLDYGSILIHEGVLKEALSQFEKAIEEAPDKVTASRLASMLCRNAGVFSEAQQFHARAMQAGLDESRGLLDEALIKKACGDETAYRAIIDGLLSADQPYPAQLCKDLGMEVFRMGKWKEAKALLLSALEQGFHQSQVCTILALACKYQGKTQEAIHWNDHAIEIDEQCVEAYINLGHLHYDRQQWAEAKANYERSLPLGGSQGDVLFRLSVIALIEEDVQRCLGYCRDTLKRLGIESNGVKEKLPDFARLYKRIADGFLRAGMTRLNGEALHLASTLEKTQACEEVKS